VTPSNNITAWNLRAPVVGPIVNSGGAPASQEITFRTNLMLLLQTMGVVNVANFGAKGNGRTDDTAAFQLAINQAISLSSQLGMGVVQIPAGTFPLNQVTIPASAPPISIIGQGTSTILIRNGQVAPGHGVLDIYASNVTLGNFVIDGATTVPQGLQYGVGFNGIGGNDPMAAALSNDTSIWLHGGMTNFSCSMLRFQHAGGYSLLIDATSQTITSVSVDECQFFNNRPTLFGSNPAQLIYGSWNGGVLAKGDGRTTGSSVVKGLKVRDCHWERCTGNGLWSHNYGLNALNEDFRFNDNYFLDMGLDGIEPGVVTSGVVKGNVFRRIGYITTGDRGASIPRWLLFYNATALDSTGLVINIPYVDNSFLDVNGGMIDLDSHGQSVISGNVARIALPTDPEYIEDQVAISGLNNTGSTSYGISCNNSSNTDLGDSNLNISVNTLLNLPAGSIRLYGSRNCLAQGNEIVAPANSINPPMALGPVGPGPNQRCYNNRVTHNHCTYAPATSQPLILEDNTVPFVGSEVNYCFGNEPIIGNNNAIEFVKSPSSGSTVYSTTPWP
jgi:Pectate lyase superfamily protein